MVVVEEELSLAIHFPPLPPLCLFSSNSVVERVVIHSINHRHPSHPPTAPPPRLFQPMASCSVHVSYGITCMAEEEVEGWCVVDVCIACMYE